MRVLLEVELYEPVDDGDVEWKENVEYHGGPLSWSVAMVQAYVGSVTHAEEL